MTDSELIEQLVTDLNQAHDEICKLQDLRPDLQDWPEWSPQANSIREAEKRNGRKLAKTDQWTLFPSSNGGEQPQAELDSSASACCGLEQRLMSLSENAKSWLTETCERFADSQEYSKNEAAIQECLEAELIRKRRYFVEIGGEVMDLVYSQKIFSHND